jgi:hypothetical protein
MQVDQEYPLCMPTQREIFSPLRRGSRSPEEFEAAVRKVSEARIRQGREDFRITSAQDPELHPELQHSSHRGSESSDRS